MLVEDEASIGRLVADYLKDEPVAVESELGVGSTFSLRLPAAGRTIEKSGVDE